LTPLRLQRHDARMNRFAFEPDRYKWREVTGEPGLSYKVRHDYTLLGWDVSAGTLDMLVRWAGDGGHCPIHRHVATTTVLVLEGEQHLCDVLPDGTRTRPRMRRAGEYSLSLGDALPHLERGGPEGGIAFFGNHTRNGLLYEIVDEGGKVIAQATIENMVADWKAFLEG
jgi:hypothetical protein